MWFLYVVSLIACFVMPPLGLTLLFLTAVVHVFKRQSDKRLALQEEAIAAQLMVQRETAARDIELREREANARLELEHPDWRAKQAR